jgi:hypothetical protein
MTWARLPTLGLLAVLALPAQAQERRVNVQIEAVAGENAYLSIGTEGGVAAGDTLAAFRGDRLAGRLRVVSATATRSVVTFVGEPFAITRGERFEVALAAPHLVAAEPAPDTAGVPLPERRSIFERTTPPLPQLHGPTPSAWQAVSRPARPSSGPARHRLTAATHGRAPSPRRSSVCEAA